MPAPFGSDAWARALVDEINTSSEYRNAASDWGVKFNGNVLLSFGADDGLARDVHLFLRLAGGRCGGAELLGAASHDEAGFVLRAPFGLWREVLERRTKAATAILTGKLRVEGDKMLLLRHTAASRALVHCAASVDTSWDGS